MSHEIVERLRDLSGAFRVRVRMPDGSTQFLKFWEKPTQEEVDATVDAGIAGAAKAVTRAEEERVAQVVTDFRALPIEVKVAEAEAVPMTSEDLLFINMITRSVDDGFA